MNILPGFCLQSYKNFDKNPTPPLIPFEANARKYPASYVERNFLLSESNSSCEERKFQLSKFRFSMDDGIFFVCLV
jgi:hypothetical protein